MINKLLISLLIVLFSFTIASAKNKFKFGKIDESEFQICKYEIDTSASAIILFDIGEFNPDAFQFSRVLRIKILKKEGLSWANNTYNAGADANIRGKTYNLVDGEIVVNKLKNESVFKEHVTDDYFRYKVAMPNVKVGSIIDIEFIYNSIPSVWYFQYETPNLYSQLYIPDHEYIDIRKSYSGYIGFETSTRTDYIAKDIPAFKKEPYMSTPENYRAKLSMDLLRITIPGNYREYTTTYDAVAKRLSESDDFGGLIGNANYLNDWVDEINALNLSSQKDHLKAAFEKVKSIKWNGYVGMFGSGSSLRSIINEGEGNSTDINLILLNLLRKIGFEATPIVLSTRANGLISPVYPSWTKLNYTIISCNINDVNYLLDASEKYVPIGMLPERCLNYYAVALYNQVGKVIKISPLYDESTNSIISAVIGTDLSVTCKENSAASGYAALDIRREFEEAGRKEDYIIGLENDNEGLSITSCDFSGLEDIYIPISTSLAYEVSNQVFEMGDEMFINPMLYHQIKENPFKIDARQYPVDFTYNMKEGYNIYYTIPDGYTVSELPKGINLTLPENSAQFMYNVVNQNNSVRVTCNVLINK